MKLISPCLENRLWFQSLATEFSLKIKIYSDEKCFRICTVEKTINKCAIIYPTVSKNYNVMELTIQHKITSFIKRFKKQSIMSKTYTVRHK
jgi:hypothetical protein